MVLGVISNKCIVGGRITLRGTSVRPRASGGMSAQTCTVDDTFDRFLIIFSGTKSLTSAKLMLDSPGTKRLNGAISFEKSLNRRL